MASGDTLLILHPFAATLPATGFAQFDIIAGTSSPVESFPVLAYTGAGGSEVADWHLVMPRHYAGGGLTITFYWSANDTTNNVVWSAAFRRVADQGEDVDTTAHTYDFNDAAATAVPATSGNVDYLTLAFTNGADMDSVAVGEMFVLRIKRDSGNASDTATSDAFIHRVEIKET